MNDNVRREYRRLRALGWLAASAIRDAKIRVEFERLESKGLVKFEVSPDELPYDDSFVENERERKALWGRIEREGVWNIAAFALDPLTREWVHADGCCGFVGDEWKDSGYDIDVMRAAVSQARQFRMREDQGRALLRIGLDGLVGCVVTLTVDASGNARVESVLPPGSECKVQIESLRRFK